MRKPVGLHTHAVCSGVDGVRILKVLEREEASMAVYDPHHVLLWNDDIPGFAGSFGIDVGRPSSISVTKPKDDNLVQPGDIIRLREGSSLISVLYRRGSKANTLFVTEQCNSRCLMCSQPPRDEDDSWRIGELEQVIQLADRDEIQLGVTGGEPTLLGDGLTGLIETSRDMLPETGLHVLTNGRLLADRAFCERVASAHSRQTIWAVPLYADVAAIHDEVVDAPGSFVETLDGLFELGRMGARVEIRVVLHKLTVPRLPQLASFIYRRLPFVEHVALMGLEPMGYAKRNRERLWIDPVDYVSQLESSLFHLSNRGMAVSIYNLPLCVLPRRLRPFARQSISDWKNLYPDECEGCVAIDDCSGFFASSGPTWRSRAVSPLKTLEEAA